MAHHDYLSEDFAGHAQDDIRDVPFLEPMFHSDARIARLHPAQPALGGTAISFRQGRRRCHAERGNVDRCHHMQHYQPAVTGAGQATGQIEGLPRRR